MTVCTFNTTANLSPYNVSKWESKGAYTQEITLKCRTSTFSEISTLKGLQGHIGAYTLLSGRIKIQTTGGTKATLSLFGTSYSGCYISELWWNEPDESRENDVWEYTVRFTQETAP